MARLTLSLGSNLGDRRSNIEEALRRLDALLGPEDAVTPMINTTACGFRGPDFLNCLVVYNSRRRPLTILKICKEIEAQMGRHDTAEYDSCGRRIYHDRIIDIDILTYGKRKINTSTLTIPHPQVESRPFIKELLLLLQD